MTSFVSSAGCESGNPHGFSRVAEHLEVSRAACKCGETVLIKNIGDIFKQYLWTVFGKSLDNDYFVNNDIFTCFQWIETVTGLSLI